MNRSRRRKLTTQALRGQKLDLRNDRQAALVKVRMEFIIRTVKGARVRYELAGQINRIRAILAQEKRAARRRKAHEKKRQQQPKGRLR